MTDKVDCAVTWGAALAIAAMVIGFGIPASILVWTMALDMAEGVLW